MNVLNIISTTLTRQRTTYFQQQDAKRSTHSTASMEMAQARQFSIMNRNIMVEEV